MYLSRLYVKNYRSISELDVSFSKGKNVIIGRNNAGKSNLIRAIDLVLGESSPTYAKSDSLSQGDFHSWKSKAGEETVVRTARELFIWCELKRGADEALNYEEIYKCYGFNIYSEIVDWDAKNKPIKRAERISKDDIPRKYDSVFVVDEEESEREYVNPKLRHQQTFENQFENKHIFAFAFRARRDDTGTIIRDIRFLYREDSDTDWVLAFKAPIRNELLQSARVPSFRDPLNQMRLSNWTWYGKLMKHLTAGPEQSDELKAAFESVRDIGDKVFEGIKNKIVESALDVAFPGTQLHFQFNPDTQTDLFKSCLIYVDDGYKSLLTEKGSGIQSATIIGLFNYYTQYVNTVTSALLCLEEPEIYLHPHARRVVSDRLDEFLAGAKNQVILTTHSAEFIRSTQPDLNVILVRKLQDGTSASLVNLREFKDLLIESKHSELFFADKVIVCEGYDDFVLRAIAKELFPKKLDEQNISIVSVGGKDNISRLVKLILKLGIECFVFADFDYLLRDAGDERKKYDAKPHKSVASLGEAFFCQSCTFGERGKKAYARLQKLRADVKKREEEAFYTAKSSSSLSHANISVALSYLRGHGLCLLNGEIESFCLDQEFVSPQKKLSLDKVFDMSERLASGAKITDLFETSEINDFLNVVLE
jgi:putative ATP-dependent endonuclease of the OLD family